MNEIHIEKYGILNMNPSLFAQMDIIRNELVKMDYISANTNTLAFRERLMTRLAELEIRLKTLDTKKS